jgi:ribose transport system ATP-binding protein
MQAADMSTPGALGPSVSTSALRIESLTKTFVGGRALDGVELNIAPGEIHALLGENGSGKSTLIKVLAGYHRPDPGSLLQIGGLDLEVGSAHSSHALGARFVHQDLGLVESASISDNLAFGPGFPTKWGTIRSRRTRLRATAALEQMELDLDPGALIESLSPAQKTGVAVARALLADSVPDSGQPAGDVQLLVLDEPTARLPDSEVEHLLEIVRTVADRGIGVLYVTHRLDEVFQIAERASVLRDGVKVASEPVAGLTRDALLHHLLGAALEQPHRLNIADESSSAAGQPKATLSVDRLTSDVLTDVSFEVFPGEVVGVAGITGSGRDALCATIFGARACDEGTVHIRSEILPARRPDLAMSRDVAYVPAERKLQGCFLDLSARENISIANLRDFWRVPLLSRTKETAITKRWFERLGVRPREAIGQPLSSFSGGNQQKVVFGKWFQRVPVMFLLDEPTQGVDVGAKAELHSALFDAAQEGAAILMSSSDVDELVTVCDRVIVMRSGRIADTLHGDQINVHSITRSALGMAGDVVEPGSESANAVAS